MKKNSFLITGGAGYIGSMLTTKLVHLGYRVTVIDTLKYSKSSLNHLNFFDNFSFVYGDVRDKKLMKKLIKNNEFIIPLAALVGAPLCEKNKKEAISVNYTSIKFLVKNISRKSKIIFPTSNSGYGVGKKNKYCDESSPLKPISLYGRTKADAEKAIMNFKNSICFRLATVFGFSYRMRTDLLVNNFVYEAVKKKKIQIFEPHFRRNFIHVDDVVKGIIFAMKNFNKLKSNIYNLGLSSANLSKLMLAKKIKKKVKKLKITVIKNRKDPDQRDYYVSNKKIEKKGFKAKTKIEQGIEELVNLFEKNTTKIINNY